MAQKCSCPGELKYLEGKVERDLPSYYDQVILQGRHTEYWKHKQECDAISGAITDSSQCIYLLAKYLSFFRDEHLSVNYQDRLYGSLWENNDTFGLKQFFSRERRYMLPPMYKTPNGPEGFWQSRDNKMIVRVVKQPTPLWDYAGLIISGDTRFWSRGQLKFYLKEKGKDNYECMYLSGSRRPRLVKATMTDTLLVFGRLTDFHRINDTVGRKATVNTGPGRKMEFKSLSNETNYVRIASFDYELFEQIDSMLNANKQMIVSKPNLIIDVRENGGGSDRCYYPLLNYILDDKAVSFPLAASLYASDGLIEYYTKNKYKYCENKQDSLDEDTSLMIMQQHRNQFTPHKFATGTMDTIYTYPKRVAIIMDRWCASSTEGFIMTAKQSGKVTLYGENTWGCSTYGDLITIDMPCLPVEINMPTKKMHMRDGGDYESIGIAPNVKLNPDENSQWLSQVQYMEQKK